MEEKTKQTRAVKFCLSFNNLNSIKNKNKKMMGQQDSTENQQPKIKRSMSCVGKRFVPRIAPKKSTIIPSLLKLNNNENEINEIVSVKDCSISDDSSSFGSSASFKFEESKEKQIKNEDLKYSEEDSFDDGSSINNNNVKTKLQFDDSPKMMEEILEVKEKEDEENIPCIRKKMSKIKKSSGNKNSEDEDIIHEDLKNKFDINNNSAKKKNNDLLNEKDINCKFGMKHSDQKVKRKPILIRDVLLGSYKKKNMNSK